MYVTPCGGTVATVVQSKGGACGSRVLTQAAQRRLINLRGLGISANGAAVRARGITAAGAPTLVPATTSTVTTSLPTVRPTAPILLAPPWRNRQPPPTTGTAITPTPPTGPAIPGSPVPQNYPTSRLFVDASGNTWQYSSSTGQWAQVGTAGASAQSGYIANTAVPVGTPTNTPYVDGRGNIWTYSAAAGTWVNTSVYGSGAGSYNVGSPVPQGYPTNQVFTDPATGYQWVFSSASGTWVNSSAYGSSISALQAPAAATDTSALPSSAQSILDWLSQQTLITGIPNWAIAAGAGLLALKLSGGKR